MCGEIADAAFGRTPTAARGMKRERPKLATLQQEPRFKRFSMSYNLWGRGGISAQTECAVNCAEGSAVRRRATG